MYQECNEIEWHLNWVSGKFKFLKNPRAKLPFAKTSLFKDEIGRNHPMNGCIAMRCRLIFDGGLRFVHVL